MKRVTRFAPFVAALVVIVSLASAWASPQDKKLLLGAGAPSGCAGYGSPVARYKASAIVGLSDGDPVTTWSDSSGTGNDITQATSGNKPSYQTNEINSTLPVVQFDGNDFLSKTSISTYSQPNTVFIVAKQTSVGGTGAFLLDGYYVAGARNGLYCEATSGYLKAYAGSVVASTTACSTSAFEVLEAVYNGASSQIWINGTSVATGDVGAQALGGNLYVGGDLALGDYYYNGKVAEILIYNSDVGSTNRSAYRRCLGGEYTITVTP